MKLWKQLCGILGRAYELVWSCAPGRPWTYAIREWAHRHPTGAAFCIPAVVAAVVAGQVLSMVRLPLGAGIALVILGDFLFFAGGHLFWDTAGEYIKPGSWFQKARGLLSMRGGSRCG